MKLNIFRSQTKRTKIFTVITVLLIAVVLLLNYVMTYYGHQNTIFFDLTPEDFYTVTDRMIEECSFVDGLKDSEGNAKKVKITFCNDPDYLRKSQNTRLIYFLALQLQGKLSGIEVETVNVRNNPTAVAQYKTTSLTAISPTDIIVSYDGRYRISTADSYWMQGNAYDDDYFFNGEYRFASLIKSVTAINQPTAYFLTGHGESYYDAENPESEMSVKMASLYDLLLQRGLKVDTLELSAVEKIPDDCALLIINNPRSDFSADPDRFNDFTYVSETEMLDEYLVTGQGAIMVSKDYRISLPLFDDFLYEWGFDMSDTQLKDSENSINEESTAFRAQYITDENSYGYTIYGEYADLSSAPLTVFSDTGYIDCAFNDSSAINEPGSANVSRRFVSFLSSYSTAKAYAKNSISGEYVDFAGDAKSYHVAALSIRESFNSIENLSTQSYIFAVNSPDFFSADTLGNESYANFDIVTAVVDNISKIDDYASIELGGDTFNSPKYGGKRHLTLTMKETPFKVHSNMATEAGNVGAGTDVVKENSALTKTAKIVYSVIAGVIPLSIAVLGAVVCIKRKYK